MPSKEELLKEAGSSSDPARAEALYKEILASSVSEHASTEAREAELLRQESALIKLGELYRDHKCVAVLTATNEILSGTRKALRM
ncbi:hypothetical protein BD413DRAFT_615143 [Trametes elegans]|nr:hypothetical protein BD413DRAFT_615143 [Trametes elegans]